MPSPITTVIGRKKTFTTAENGQFLLLSDTGGELAGAWAFQFVPNAQFVGALSVQARIQGQQAYDDAVGFQPVPFRCAVFNGVVSDYSLKTSTDLVTGQSVFYVPATGLAVALLVECTAGGGTIYSYPRQGDGMVV